MVWSLHNIVQTQADVRQEYYKLEEKHSTPDHSAETVNQNWITWIG